MNSLNDFKQLESKQEQYAFVEYLIKKNEMNEHLVEYHGFKPYLFWKKIRKWIGSLVFPFKYYYLVIKSRADIVICNEPVKLLSQLIDFFISKIVMRVKNLI